MIVPEAVAGAMAAAVFEFADAEVYQAQMVGPQQHSFDLKPSVLNHMD